MHNSRPVTRRRLMHALALLESVPAGRLLLETMRAQNVHITTTARLRRGTHGGYDDDKKSVILPRDATFPELLEILAHELRHAWQYTLLPVEKTRFLTLHDKLAITRQLEGDAYAFSNLVLWQINRKHGTHYRLRRNAAGSTPRRLMNRVYADFQQSAVSVAYDLQEFKWFEQLEAAGVSQKGQLCRVFAAAARKNRAALEKGRFYHLGVRSLAGATRKIKPLAHKAFAASGL